MTESRKKDSHSSTARILQLVVSSVVIGLGVALLLRAALGSDGYSTLINGLALSTGVTFGVVNLVVGVVLVGLAWWKGRRPAVGTVVQPVVVGFAVSAFMGVVEQPDHLAARIGLLAAGFVVISVGVAGYLGSGTGAGPSEALSLAWDPPIPFRWSYNLFQAVCGVIGWLLGASVNVGTVVVIGGLGPVIDQLGRWFPMLDPHGRRGRPEPTRTTIPGRSE